MKSKINIIIIHVLAFLGLSVIFLMLSDRWMVWLYPDYGGPSLWINTMVIAMGIFLVLCLTSCLLFLRRAKRH